ncbi:MAG: sialate O-acetylesterase, partial [Victivallaceae bacterium]
QMRYYDKSTPACRAELERCAKMYDDYAVSQRKSAKEGVAPAPVPVMPRGLFLPDNMAQPAVHFNAMINPLVPMALKGVFWYQGGANIAGKTPNYGKMLEHLAADWRGRFNRPELPFFVVQNAPYDYTIEYHTPLDTFPTLVNSQQQFTADDQNAWLAVTNDVGNVNDIHPTDKVPVGTRVANLCLAHLYGKDIAADSPQFKDYSISGNVVTVRFSHGEGLTTSDGKTPDWFEIAGADGVFQPAAVVIEHDTVKLTSPKVPAPVAVRFSWSCVAEHNLRNGAGLPSGPFKIPVPERGNLDKCVPEASNFEVIYRYIPNAQPQVATLYNVKYDIDNTDKFAGRKIRRVGYFAEGVLPDGSTRWVFVAMDPFTADISKLGVPLGPIFQQKVSNLEVASNVPGVAAGKFPEGAIEFWHNNFDPKRKLDLPGASDKLYDWDDTYQPDVPNGHGSMQVHNISGEKPQVVFAYNKFAAGPECEFGIGTNPDPKGQPDYVYSDTGKQYRQINIIVLAEFEK